VKHTLKLATTYTDTASGNQYQLPAVYTRGGILISHLRYLAWYSEKSDSWREKSVLSVRLLIDYVEATPTFDKATALLKNFTQALVTGTIDFESINDSLGLFWKPRNLTDANSILFHITQYTDFLALQERHDRSRINTFKKATSWEQRMNWCAYYHKQANVFLNHLSSHSAATKTAAQKRVIYAPERLSISNDKAERFPEDKIESLIQHGFLVGDTPDYRSQAMTMLLNYGGLRKSEIFHIFTSDITIHPTHNDEALVRVYHPMYGTSPDNTHSNRAAYLQAETYY
jgi:hypothetical protein